MNKQELHDRIEEASPFIGMEFTIFEKLTQLAKKTVPVAYKFISIPSPINLNDDPTKKTYRAYGMVENTSTGKTKKMPLVTIINAFSNNN